MIELLKMAVVIAAVLLVLYRIRTRYLPMPKQPSCGIDDCRRCGLCEEKKLES
ncbi:MAG: hypothetical protein LBS40_06605 [Burkholderiales bacterium]|nr:hypothetical protein [Burkholderiales bacterium]